MKASITAVGLTFALGLALSVSAAPRVGIACDRGDRAALTRLADELVALGYDVQSTGLDDHERVGRSTGLSAHFAVGERHIHVRVAQRDGDRYEVREAIIDLGHTDEESSTAITRAVEFLRASLIEVGTQPPPRPSGAIPPPFARGREMEPARPREPGAATLALGGGLLHSSGGVGTNAVFEPAIGFSLSRALGLRLLAAIPVSSAVVRGPEGDATVRPSVFALSALWTPVRSAWVTPYFEAGLGAVLLSVSGRASAGYVSRDETAFSGLPFVGGGVLFFPGRVRLRLGAVVGTALQREEVRFVGREVGTWGTWVTGATAAVEMRL